MSGARKRKNKRPGKGERERLKSQRTAGSDPTPHAKKPQVSPTLPTLPSTPAPTAASTYNFQVDYNDHFETPFEAYRDLKPFLELGVVRSGVDSVLYDPYFCQGRCREYLQRLGFSRVINENVDFYRQMNENKIPQHDMLVTNPPYSGDHKQQLLTYLLKRSDSSVRPFALLLPAYTATKSYWREFVDLTKSKHGDASAFLYLMPSKSYEYDHPEGTGKEVPPFYSCWFLGGFPAARIGQVEKKLTQAGNTVLRSVEEMVERGFVIAKRPNPRQRKKKSSSAVMTVATASV